VSARSWVPAGQGPIGASSCATTALGLPMHDDDSARVLRVGLVVIVVACHLCAAWIVIWPPMLAVRASEAAPLFASLIRQESAVSVPAPDTPAPQPRPAVKPRSPIAAPVVSTTAPVAQTQPTAEASVSDEAESRLSAPPTAVPATTVVSAPAVAEPRVLPSSALRYLVPPAPVYPVVSRRLGEAGEVDVKVLIGIDGRARHISVQRSSGYPRLDGSAVEAVRDARFIPYTEHGEALVAWTVVPIVFHLEN
jgi:periplasmic protein TonB